MNSQIVKNKKEMLAFARTIAKQLIEKGPGKRATVIVLSGELGAGKTTFTQALLRALGVTGVITSPTFLIIKPYVLTDIDFTHAFHIDCYRLDDASELLELGFKDLIENPKHLVIIEWPERVKKYLPKDTQWITISHSQGETERAIQIV